MTIFGSLRISSSYVNFVKVFLAARVDTIFYVPFNLSFNLPFLMVFPLFFVATIEY